MRDWMSWSLYWRRTMPDGRYELSSLPEAEQFALLYATALISQDKSLAQRRFQLAVEHYQGKGVHADERRRIVQRGMNGLMARGIIEAEKNGEGEWVPTIVHFERIITNNLQ